MEMLGLLLLIVGGIGGFLASFWFLLVAYEKSLWWCLACLFIPFAALVFLVLHWNKAGRPFLAQVVCFVPLLAGMFLSGPQAGFGRSAEIRRYTVAKESKSTMPLPPMDAGSPTSAVKLSYDVPQGWREIAAGGMRQAAFEVQQGDDKAEITVISLPGAAGGLLDNVNRWRGQVKLPPTDLTALEAESTKRSIGGIEGRYVELVGPASEAKRETILGGIVMYADQMWFIKLRAPSALADREKPAFEAFLGSIKFSSDDGA